MLHVESCLLDLAQLTKQLAIDFLHFSNLRLLVVYLLVKQDDLFLLLSHLLPHMVVAVTCTLHLCIEVVMQVPQCVYLLYLVYQLILHLGHHLA